MIESKVELSSVNAELFETMLGYMYTGNIRITQDTMLQIIQIAEQFELKELKNQSVDYLLKGVNKDSVVEFMLDARKGKFKFDVHVILQKCVLILEDKAGNLLQ